jgi:hypothetical protein
MVHGISFDTDWVCLIYYIACVQSRRAIGCIAQETQTGLAHQLFAVGQACRWL